MAVIRVSCPSCDGLFEVNDDYRGEEVECHKCEDPFRIPETGTKGIALTGGEDDEAIFELSCPSCSAVFELPEEYRGELAECTECETLFLIPEEGNVGVIAEDDEDVSAGDTTIDGEESASGVSGPGDTGASGASEPEVITSGVQRGGGGARDRSFKKSATVRISRDAVIQNTMKPRAMSAQRKTSPIPESSPESVASGGSPGSRAPTVQWTAPSKAEPSAPSTDQPSTPSTAQPAASSTGKPTTPSPPKPPAEQVVKQPDEGGRRGAVSYPPSAIPGGAPAPPRVTPPAPPSELPPEPAMPHISETSGRGLLVRKGVAGRDVELPAWAPVVQLQNDEELFDCEEGVGTGPGKALGLTIIPVILIPVTGIVSLIYDSIWPALLLLVLGGMAWAVYMTVAGLRQTRTAVLVTTRRVILIEDDHLGQVDIES